MTQNGRVFLLDGTSYSYRAFYAIRELSTSQGLPTNAVYGFLLMLRRLLEAEDPEYLAVAFDAKGPTFRHEQFREYKVRRRPMPDPLIAQMAMIKELLAAYRTPIYECPGYEADDVLATLANQAVAQGLEVYLATADKDAFQLVGPKIKVYRWEGDDPVVIDDAYVQAQWGVPPTQLVDVMALAGDSTDDVPGVPGIGPKRAAELIRQYGSVDQLLQALPSIEPAARRQVLEAHRDRIVLNRSLVTVRTDAPVTLDLATLRRQPPETARLYTLFRQWEFKRQLKEVTPADDLVGCAVGASRDQLDYVGIDASGAAERLAPRLRDPAIPKVGHDLKALRVELARRGIALEGDQFDTMVAGYLVDPEAGAYPFEGLAREYLGRTPDTGDSATAQRLALKDARPRALAQALWDLRLALTAALTERGLMTLYREIEHPLIRVLAAMELSGVAVDLAVLTALSAELTQALGRLTAELYEIAGRPFNLNSPKQLATILFEELKLPVVKRIKTGASTDEEVLQRLSTQHALPATILRYRELAKLKSTYVDALPAMVSPDTGRIHTSFNQTATATGRLSSSNPNLQNIPIRTEVGRQIRRAFVSRFTDGWIVAADYSQIELRVLAHLSQDATLCAAFREGQDIHRTTAAQVFRVHPEQVTESQRAAAKTINFGILYGMTPFGLSKELAVDPGQAEQFITAYFQRYPGVKAYLGRSLEEARRLGHCTTLHGRRRYVPMLASENPAVRQVAERTAINAPIQGSAADLIKVAMIRLHEALARRGLRALMVMQVHDELVFDVPPEELETVRQLAAEEMRAAAPLAVPVEVHVNAGRNWLEAGH